jgi:hypothetical protein
MNLQSQEKRFPCSEWNSGGSETAEADAVVEVSQSGISGLNEATQKPSKQQIKPLFLFKSYPQPKKVVGRKYCKIFYVEFLDSLLKPGK